MLNGFNFGLESARSPTKLSTLTEFKYLEALILIMVRSVMIKFNCYLRRSTKH